MADLEVYLASEDDNDFSLEIAEFAIQAQRKLDESIEKTIKENGIKAEDIDHIRYLQPQFKGGTAHFKAKIKLKTK